MLRFISLLFLFVASLSSSAFVHPGILHTEEDFVRIREKVNAQEEPWYTGWTTLTANSHAQVTYTMRGPRSVVVRGTNSADGSQNYVLLYNDIAAAYQLAVRWRVSNDTSYADRAVAILDAWSSTLTRIGGSSDKFLASGIYGYQFANAAELMRDYSGWPAANLTRFQNMMADVFYPMNYNFLENHNGAAWYHYRANWDICNMASALSIAILNDNQTMFDYAINSFTTNVGTGNIGNAIWVIHTEEGSGKRLGQNEEAGRDQGHATLDFALWGAYAQAAYNQGEDLFAYNDSQILAGAEYVAKYNVGFDVPYTPHVNRDYNETVISASSRGSIRPSWELLYAHYSSLKGLNASWTEQMRDLVLNSSTNGVEGGGGNYGANSGGYDQLGFGTLLHRLEVRNT
ncbi:GPI anchored protein [Desarmillaria tabescens]|uniref:GPI anchored protein n=1 Tax=Armillaria tabescens TaxID=1929756 RepID=A0AA39TVE7_ARMTA|nr:GPI anchored protein [Desarmillaria tabescens]KAK0464549.1 GPI anchored protein [Desarmillaria tabescens]